MKTVLSIMLVLLTGCATLEQQCQPGRWCDTLDEVWQSDNYPMGSRQYPYVHIAGEDVIIRECFQGTISKTRYYLDPRISTVDQLGCIMEKDGEWHIYTYGYISAPATVTDGKTYGVSWYYQGGRAIPAHCAHLTSLIRSTVTGRPVKHGVYSGGVDQHPAPPMPVWSGNFPGKGF